MGLFTLNQIGTIDGVRSWHARFVFSGASAGTPFVFFPNSKVGPKNIMEIHGFTGKVDGGNRWELISTIAIQSTGGEVDVLLIEDAEIVLTSFSKFWGFSQQSGVSDLIDISSFDLKALPVGEGAHIVADGNDPSASDLLWNIWGIVRPATAAELSP